MKISKWDLLMRDNVLNGAVWDDMGFLLTLIWEVFLGSNRMSNYHTTNTIESTVLLCISADVECTLGGSQGSRSYATYPHALSPHWPFVRIKETNDNNVIFVSSNFWGDFCNKGIFWTDFTKFGWIIALLVASWHSACAVFVFVYSYSYLCNCNFVK